MPSWFPIPASFRQGKDSVSRSGHTHFNPGICHQQRSVPFLGRSGREKDSPRKGSQSRPDKGHQGSYPEDLELEAFVHGAMCVSYSGRCLLSNYFTGRRSNGGACAQPCRWSYSVVEEKRPDMELPVEQDDRGTYIFGSRDLCMIEHIPELIEAGVNSLKIEGRIKGEYYAAATTKVYREAVDAYFEDPENYQADPRHLVILDKVVHRDYDTGFFFDNPMDDAKIDYQKTYNKPAFVVGEVDSSDPVNGLTKVIQKNKLFRGDELNVLMPEGTWLPSRFMNSTIPISRP